MFSFFKGRNFTPCNKVAIDVCNFRGDYELWAEEELVHRRGQDQRRDVSARLRVAQSPTMFAQYLHYSLAIQFRFNGPFYIRFVI
jgi:hypothetical protein